MQKTITNTNLNTMRKTLLILSLFALTFSANAQLQKLTMKEGASITLEQGVTSSECILTLDRIISTAQGKYYILASSYVNQKAYDEKAMPINSYTFPITAEIINSLPQPFFEFKDGYLVISEYGLGVILLSDDPDLSTSENPIKIGDRWEIPKK